MSKSNNNNNNIRHIYHEFVFSLPPSLPPQSPKSPYALQKSIIEDVLTLYGRLYDLDSVALRYFNVFGSHQLGSSPYSTAIAAWCQAIKDGRPLRSDGTGEQSRDLCHVDNVVDANLKAVARYVTFWMVFFHDFGRF